jgi:hypothetical protein
VTSIIPLTYPCGKPRGGHTGEPVERRSASDAGKGGGHSRIASWRSPRAPLATGFPTNLAARLTRDHQELAAEVETGRKSLRAAAREAGILKDPDPGRQLRRW